MIKAEKLLLIVLGISAIVSIAGVVYGQTIEDNQLDGIIEWQYKGHDMLEYKYRSICHSPVCKKCYQIYD